MDAYAEVLEHLRADDFRRLREFATHPRSKTSTWLVVIARRVCLDIYRRRYGRSDGILDQRRTRRRLQDLIAEQLEVHDVAGPESAHTDLRIRRSELYDALHAALAELPPAGDIEPEELFSAGSAPHVEPITTPASGRRRCCRLCSWRIRR
jgi:DNA-directed RNA polymerase specialized sigma24 family protein